MCMGHVATTPIRGLDFFFFANWKSLYGDVAVYAWLFFDHRIGAISLEQFKIKIERNILVLNHLLVLAKFLVE